MCVSFRMLVRMTRTRSPSAASPCPAPTRGRRRARRAARRWPRRAWRAPRSSPPRRSTTLRRQRRPPSPPPPPLPLPPPLPPPPLRPPPRARSTACAASSRAPTRLRLRRRRPRRECGGASGEVQEASRRFGVAAGGGELGARALDDGGVPAGGIAGTAAVALGGHRQRREAMPTPRPGSLLAPSRRTTKSSAPDALSVTSPEPPHVAQPPPSLAGGGSSAAPASGKVPPGTSAASHARRQACSPFSSTVVGSGAGGMCIQIWAPLVRMYASSQL